MIFMFTEPFPAFEAWLVEHGHTVVNKDRNVFGVRYIDDIQYPMKRFAQEVRADVVVVPELWGADQMGYSKEQLLTTAQRATTVAFTSPFGTWRGAGNCRARPHNVCVAVYTDEAEAKVHARSTGRSVFFSGDFQPVLAAITHHRTKQRYTTHRATPWR
jgi:hypothetical protein